MEEDISRPRRRLLGMLGRAGLEVVSIVLGVLLALAVSEWQDDRHNRERVAAALGNVHHELLQNLALLEGVHAGNAELVETLSGPDRQEAAERQFIPGLQVSISAWEVLRTTGLANFVDYGVLLELSRTYATVDVYRRAAYALMDANFSMLATASAMGQLADDSPRLEAFAANFAGQFRLLVDIEAALIEAHRAAIAAVAGGPIDGTMPAER